MLQKRSILTGRIHHVKIELGRERPEEQMRLIKAILILVALHFAGAMLTKGQTSSTQEVTALLREFIAGAGSGDRALFDKFFADDVIYTRATGLVITKADIMANLGRSSPATEAKSSYSAQDITVHEYGDTVVVAFRLVGRTEARDGKVETSLYRNTGTFLRRNGRWQAVAWQATKMTETQATH
jgi:ketosteroid isomerase-like protein